MPGSDGRGYLLPPEPLPEDGDDICQVVWVPNDPYYFRAMLGQITDLGKWFLWERDPDKRGASVSARYKSALERTLLSWGNEDACSGELPSGTAKTKTYNFIAGEEGVWEVGSTVCREKGTYLGGWGWGCTTYERISGTFRRCLSMKRDWTVARTLGYVEITYYGIVDQPVDEQAYIELYFRNALGGIVFRVKKELYGQDNGVIRVTAPYVIPIKGITFEAFLGEDSSPVILDQMNVWFQKITVQAYAPGSVDW